MSTNQDKVSAFRQGLASAANNLSRAPAKGSARASPSPAPSQAYSKVDLKRKRPEPNATVFSQPADTGTGKHIMTQVTYAIDYIKNKATAQRYEDLVSYLSLQNQGSDHVKAVKLVLQRHNKVIYDPQGFDGKGSYAYRPKHNIRNGDQLLGYLQAQTTAQGLPVKDLVDGWPDAEDDIRALENEHKLLVIRNKKDDHARMVWPDDPTLNQRIDPEFQSIWHNVRLPDPEALVDELEKSGLLPANKSQASKKVTKAPEKKAKKTRKSGKTTNTHMVGILRDYSHLKK
jgi:transcription initiation factor TFIIE subunit beta